MPPEVAAGTNQDTPQPAASGEATSGRESASPPEAPQGLFDRVTSMLFGKREAASDEGERTDEPSAGDEPADASGTQRERRERREQAEQPKKVELTEDELNRRVQAEVDRRETKRQAKSREQQVIDLTKARDQAARDGDADTVAQAQAQIDAVDAQRTFVGGLVGSYDAVTLDVVRDALPEKERAQLLAELAELPPLDGRKHFVTKGLEALKAHWKAEGAKEAETRIRNNPTLRKQVVLGQRAERDEPELVGAGASRAGRNGHASGSDMDSLIRSAARRGGGGGGGEAIRPFDITDDDRE